MTTDTPVGHKTTSFLQQHSDLSLCSASVECANTVLQKDVEMCLVSVVSEFRLTGQLEVSSLPFSLAKAEKTTTTPEQFVCLHKVKYNIHHFEDTSGMVCVAHMYVLNNLF